MLNKEKSAGGSATPSAEINKTMPIIVTQAKEKIKVSDVKKLGKYENVVYEEVADALCLFCEQSEEFARAVVDCDKSFEDCLKEICKGLGRSISDLNLYNKAVQFYFSGAFVKFTMTICMSEYEFDEPEQTVSEKPKENIVLSLDSLLDW